MRKMSEDAKVTIGNIQLQLAFDDNHVSVLRTTLFYASTIYSYLKHSVADSEEKTKDLELIKKLHCDMQAMQKTISVGTGAQREQWKENLATLSDIQFQLQDLAVKYDFVKFAINQFEQFK